MGIGPVRGDRPLRSDLRPFAVADAARRATAALTGVVGPAPPGEESGASIAERLAARLAPSAERCRLPP